MDNKSIKELEILHEVSKNEHVNQRYLSKKLGMASGLVNLYIKRLARKGYIKITGMNPRRLKYLVTPRGIAEKTRLTYEFALISYKYFKGATDDIRKKLEELERAGQTHVVIFGTGELAEMCLLLIKEFDLQIVAVVGNPSDSSRFMGYPVVPKDLLRNLRFDKLLVAEIDADDKVNSLVSEMSIEPEKVCRLLEISAG